MRHTAIDDRGLGHGPASAGPDAGRARRIADDAACKVGNLLYVSGYGQETYILSFPKGELIGQISGGGHLCPDNAGNVWVAGYPNGYGNKLAEFAHGGKRR